MKMEPSLDTLFFRTDPVTRFFRQILRVKPLAATVIFWLVVNVPLIIAAAVKGALLTDGSRVGILDDFGWWAYQFGTFPATFYAFIWLPDGIKNVLDGLRKNKVIKVTSGKGDQRKWDDFLRQFHGFYNHPAWLVGSVVIIAVLVWFIWIPAQKTFDTWQATSTFAFWYTEFAWFLIFVIGALLIIRGIITITRLNFLFREFPVVVKVLHPDGAGGLSPLGKLSVSIGYVLCVYGIGVTIGNISQARIAGVDYLTVLTDPMTIALWAVYLVLAPIMFFLPLNVAHYAMEQAKGEYITKISDQFEIEIQRTQELLGSSSKQLKENLTKVEQLQQLHDLAIKFPIWPFNTKSLVRFFSSVLFPILLSLISALFQGLIK